MSEQLQQQVQVGQVEAEELKQARQSGFKIYQEVPLNAEPAKKDLVQSDVTPLTHFYHRNHGILRPSSDAAEDLDKWKLALTVEKDVADALKWPKWQTAGSSSITISGAEIKTKYRKRRFAAAIECAGNRRIEFNEELRTEGIEWDGGVIASLIWGGASLREVLLSYGVPDPYEGFSGKLAELPPSDESARTDAASWAQNLHVHFISTEETQETNLGERYGASITLATAMHPNQGCLLAYEHNGQLLTPAHGAPLRAVLPGIIGARWTKFLGKMIISSKENQSPAMRADYKDLRPPNKEELDKWLDTVSIQGKNTDQKRRMEELEKLPAIQRLNIGSAIAEPQDGEVIKPTKKAVVRAKGYAVGHDGLPITEVQVLLIPDLGPEKKASDIRALAAKHGDEAWISASLSSALPEEGESDTQFSFGWTLWHVDFPVTKEQHTSGKWALVARASTQKHKQEQESAWNLRGFAQRGWPVVRAISVEL